MRDDVQYRASSWMRQLVASPNRLSRLVRNSPQKYDTSFNEMLGNMSITTVNPSTPHNAKQPGVTERGTPTLAKKVNETDKPTQEIVFSQLDAPESSEGLTFEDIARAHLGLQRSIYKEGKNYDTVYPNSWDFGMAYKYLPRTYVEQFCGLYCHIRRASLGDNTYPSRAAWTLMQSPGSCVLTSCLQLVNSTPLFEKAEDFLKVCVLLFTPHRHDDYPSNWFRDAGSNVISESFQELTNRYLQHLSYESDEQIKSSSSIVIRREGDEDRSVLGTFDNGLLVPWFLTVCESCRVANEQRFYTTWDAFKGQSFQKDIAYVYKPELEWAGNSSYVNVENTVYTKLVIDFLKRIKHYCCGCMLTYDDGQVHSLAFTKESSNPDIVWFDNWDRTKMISGKIPTTQDKRDHYVHTVTSVVIESSVADRNKERKDRSGGTNRSALPPWTITTPAGREVAIQDNVKENAIVTLEETDLSMKARNSHCRLLTNDGLTCNRLCLILL